MTSPEPRAPRASDRSRAILSRWATSVLPWVLIAGGVWWFGTTLEGGSVDTGPAPPLQVDIHHGAHFDLAEQRGQVVVLNFWEAWCPPCRREAPALSRAHARLQREGRGMILGLTQEGRSVVQAERIGMRYPHAVVGRDVVGSYRVSSLPTTIVVAPDGTVSRSFVGAITTEQLMEAVDEAIEGSTVPIEPRVARNGL